ncbi:hypothetical protein Gotur_031505 [Gossypium turneri]
MWLSELGLKQRSVTQNNFQELKEIWGQWSDEVRQLFYNNHRDLPYLLDVWEGRFGAYDRGIYDFTPLFKVSSGQGLFESSKCANLFKEADECNGLVVFLKALGYVDEAVTDLFDRLDRKVTPILAILAETFRSLSAYRKMGEGRFIGCAQLLLAWFHSHFWKVDKVSYRVFSENYSPLKEIVATPRRDDISKEKWMAILQNL